MPATTFTLSRGSIVFIAGAGIALGVALGFLLPFLGSLSARFPIPFGGAIEKLSSFNSPVIVLLRPIIGGVAGLILAIVVAATQPVVTVDDDEVRVRKGSDDRVLPRRDIAGVHRAGGDYVIESHGGRVLFKGSIEGSRADIRRAFTDRGYPWEMAD